MSEVDYSAYSRSREAVENKRTGQQRTMVKAEQPQHKPVVQPQPAIAITVEPVSQEKQAVQDLETKLESIGIDSTVVHKKFGKGTVVKINKNEKFIHIKVYVTSYGIETKKDYAKFFLIRKTRLQQYQSDLSWKKVQMSLLDIMR